MQDCAPLTSLSRFSLIPTKTIAFYEFSSKNRKPGSSTPPFKPRNCLYEVLGDINGEDVLKSSAASIWGQSQIVGVTFEKRKYNSKSRSFGNEMLGKIDGGGFTKLLNCSYRDLVECDIGRNGVERHQLKSNCRKLYRNFGMFKLESYNVRYNLKPRSFGSKLVGWYGDQEHLQSMNLSNLDYVGDRSSRMWPVIGDFKKDRGEKDGLRLNCTIKNWNSGVLGPQDRDFLDELITKKERKGFESKMHSKYEEAEDAGMHAMLAAEMEENTSGRKLVVNEDDSANGKKENNLDGDPSLASTTDFIQSKSSLENHEEIMSSDSQEGSDLVPTEGSKENKTESDDGSFVGRSGLRRRKQVLRRNTMLAKQVISMQSALSLGFVSQLWVDTRSWAVLLVEVRPSMLSGEMQRFLLEDICKVGDVVLLQDESVIENEFKMIGLDTLVGYKVITPGRRNIGKVRGFTFNIYSGAVELLELDSLGISIIPASLVSTYGLPVDDVLEVTSDTVVVHEDAASRIQRLSKGFWDIKNVGFREDELWDYTDIGRRPIQSVRGQSSENIMGGQKFPRKMRETGGDWELPMDY